MKHLAEKAYYVCKSLVPQSVDDYWGMHTVSPRLANKDHSLRQFEHVCHEYTNYCHHAGLRNPFLSNYTYKRILVYGCGTGTEIVPIMEHSKPENITGVDISKNALSICEERVGYHTNNNVVKLKQIDAKHPHLGEENFYDYVICLGVLHHIPVPTVYTLLKEINRVMKPGASMRVMVYNEDSIYYHLSIGYVYQIVKNIFRNDPTHDAFRKISEHGNSPCSYIMKPEWIPTMASYTGFNARFIGTSISQTEMKDYNKYYEQALNDPRLPSEHKRFLSGMDGYKYNGRYAGIDQFWEFVK